MQVYSINSQQQNYNPNFKATIKIKKDNLVNLTKDIGDSSLITTSGVSMLPSATVESTIFPMEAQGVGLVGTMKRFANAIKKLYNRILNRPIKPIAVEGDTTAIKEASKITRAETTGSGILSTGVGSYTSAGASMMDQSVHYPCLGSDSLPEGALRWMRENPLQDSAYDLLYNEHGLGNECASSSASIVSVPGTFSHSVGSQIIAAPKKFAQKGFDAIESMKSDIPS